MTDKTDFAQSFFDKYVIQPTFVQPDSGSMNMSSRPDVCLPPNCPHDTTLHPDDENQTDYHSCANDDEQTDIDLATPRPYQVDTVADQTDVDLSTDKTDIDLSAGRTDKVISPDQTISHDSSLLEYFGINRCIEFH